MRGKSQLTAWAGQGDGLMEHHLGAGEVPIRTQYRVLRWWAPTDFYVTITIS